LEANTVLMVNWVLFCQFVLVCRSFTAFIFKFLLPFLAFQPMASGPDLKAWFDCWAYRERLCAYVTSKGVRQKLITQTKAKPTNQPAWFHWLDGLELETTKSKPNQPTCVVYWLDQGFLNCRAQNICKGGVNDLVVVFVMRT